jgi:hypothetical protein
MRTTEVLTINFKAFRLKDNNHKNSILLYQNTDKVFYLQAKLQFAKTALKIIKIKIKAIKKTKNLKIKTNNLRIKTKKVIKKALS